MEAYSPVSEDQPRHDYRVMLVAFHSLQSPTHALLLPTLIERPTGQETLSAQQVDNNKPAVSLQRVLPVGGLASAVVFGMRDQHQTAY